jgi:hydrogenase nickel incorporation protein HypB
MSNTPRILEVRTRVLKKNDELARDRRARFERAGALVVNMMSSPDTGKTAFLEGDAHPTRSEPVTAMVGYLEADNDVRQLARSGVPVRQIQTHGLCHLQADMIAAQVESWDLARLHYLCIENVGNLVCPTSWDLGESVRLALLSVTEGEDKPLKYPGLFSTADVAAITKIDLAAACEFDRDLARANIEAVRPGMRILETSAKSGAGLDELLACLAAHRAGLSAADSEHGREH